MLSVVRSVSHSQCEILQNISALHCPDGYDADLTYGNGGFWKTMPPPVLRFDLEALSDGVVVADASRLPLRSGSIGSAVCDLPFMTYVKRGREHKEGKVSMSARFSGYYSFPELSASYRSVLAEASRVLRVGGVLVFKCQDIVHNHKLHPTHIFSVGWAKEAGMRLMDMFILAAKHRMPGPQKGKQRHARIYHSYFLVFQKERAIAQ